MKKIVLGIFMVTFLVCIAFMSEISYSLEIGDMAPDFSLHDETNTVRSLKEFSGKKVVLYFYPKDDSPYCTKQACSFKDNAHTYAQKSIVVLGINYSSPQSHADFKKKYQLPFALLSDIHANVAKAYGAYSGIFAWWFPDRKTFLINEKGKIVHIFDTIQVATHADEVIKTFCQG